MNIKERYYLAIKLDTHRSFHNGKWLNTTRKGGWAPKNEIRRHIRIVLFSFKTSNDCNSVCRSSVRGLRVRGLRALLRERRIGPRFPNGWLENKCSVTHKKRDVDITLNKHSNLSSRISTMTFAENNDAPQRMNPSHFSPTHTVFPDSSGGII